MKTLVIVESGTKAKEIQHIINSMGYSDWTVKASSGHIKHLPVKSMGVNIAGQNISVDLVFIDGKKKLVDSFKHMARGAQVLLATDPDREGEAIAYHLYRELSGTTKRIKRVKFHAITPEGIKKGLNNIEDIDIQLVLAQTARTVLDRLWGYRLSFPLADALGDRNASVGRVQSAALKMIYDREFEIRNFKPVPYWVVTFSTDDGAKFESQKFKDKDAAEKMLRKIREKGLAVSDIEKSRFVKNPPQPLKASTLQQMGSKKLNMSSSETMKIAQELFQSRGLISYMRTDSVRSDPETVRDAFSLIKTIDANVVPAKPNNHRNGKGATQDAHECIHPTHFDMGHSPENMKSRLSDKEFKLYSLIWNRYLASQSKGALWENTKISASVPQEDPSSHTLTCIGKRLIDPGWTIFEPASDKTIPVMTKGERLRGKESLDEKKTEPKPRFDNASLIKAMETSGIGRPSTYATVNETLLKRGFIEPLGKAYRLTPKGEKSIAFEQEVCPDLINIKYTAQMEDSLDAIAEKKQNWKDVVFETDIMSRKAEQIAGHAKTNPLYKLSKDEKKPLSKSRAGYGKNGRTRKNASNNKRKKRQISYGSKKDNFIER